MGPKARAVKFYSTVSDRSEVIHLISRLFSSDGGPGSGNHGHAGRPGKVGGSAPEGSVKAEQKKKIKIGPNAKMVEVPIGSKSTSGKTSSSEPQTREELVALIEKKRGESYDISREIWKKEKEYDELSDKFLKLKLVNKTSSATEEEEELLGELRKCDSALQKLRGEHSAYKDEINGLERDLNELDRIKGHETPEKKEPQTKEELEEEINLKEEDVVDINREIRFTKNEMDELRHKIALAREAGEHDNADLMEERYYELKSDVDGLAAERDEAIRKVEDLKKKLKDMEADEEKAEAAEHGLTVEEFHVEKAKEKFGITDYFDDAGFILPDGSLLDFGEDTTDHRTMDHREVASVIPGDGSMSEKMGQFRSEGNIRHYPEIPGINISIGKEPTPEQYRKIEEAARYWLAQNGQFCIDFSDEDGNMIGQLAYVGDEGDVYEGHEQVVDGSLEGSEQIVRDLQAFYNGSEYEDEDVRDKFGKPTFAHDAEGALNYKRARDGGPGSGNFGHEGRPGKVGGSGPGGGKPYRTQKIDGGYVGVQKAKAFKSIAKQARSCKDVKEFVDSFSREQYDAIVEQYRQSGSKEEIWDYTERLWRVMSKQKPEPKKFDGVVEGRDMSEGYQYLPDKTSYNDPVTGQVVDTQIENAMSKQGFLGMPRIVSQEEFDKIVAENPDMPILYRSYAGENPEQTQEFDDMLESGEWYVDCFEGGAGFGQGMYCAGVYPQERLYQFDDPHFDDEEHWDLVVFTDNKGNGFVTKNRVRPDISGDLYVDVPYLIIGADGKRRMIRMDEESLLWLDVNTGSIVDEGEIDKMISRGDTIYECKDQDIGVYEDAYKEGRERGIRGAIEEMRHYRVISENRIADVKKPDVPDGMGLAWYEGEDARPMYYYYDPEKATSVADNPPEPWTRVVLHDPEGGDMRRNEKRIYKLNDTGRFISVDGQSSISMEEAKQYGYVWTEVEGRCEDKKVSPTSSTRLMTLDPSAKIITYNELRSLMGERGLHGDPGVAAVILGYDAINAEGHGESGSYTVVLNRTKLIISEQRVDVAA